MADRRENDGYMIQEVEKMQDILSGIGSGLFEGIGPEERTAVLGCIGYHTGSFRKGEVVVFEEDDVRHIGLLLSGTVDMVKEDVWGGRTLLVRLGKDALFGETFVCGDDSVSAVTFQVWEDAKILFLPFDRVMHSCTMACGAHHQLIRNMVRVIANKNRELMRKVEVVSKRSIREKVLTYLSIQAQLQGTRSFQIPLGRVELAQYLCVDRSALTRELAKLKEEGLIDYQRDRFQLL